MSLVEGDLLTVQRALRILPVGKSMLYRLVEEGQIPAIRVRSVGSKRGRILILRASLERYVRQREAAIPRPAPKVSVDDLRDRVRTGRLTNGGLGSASE